MASLRRIVGRGHKLELDYATLSHELSYTRTQTGSVGGQRTVRLP
jgi:hypothetical protein